MLWDLDHSEVRRLFLWLFRWEVKWSSDQIGTFLAQVLVENDLVHRLREVDIELVEEGCRVGSALAT